MHCKYISYNVHSTFRIQACIFCVLTCWFTALGIVDSSATSTPTPTPPTVPHGVFSLVPPGAPIKAATLANPSVDGISIRQAWADLEPSEGVFNWAYLDTEIGLARAAGKKVLLRIEDGALNIPPWVMNGMVTTFSYVDLNPYHSSYGSTITIPVFWDSYYLAKKTAMIAAVGASYTGNSAVKIVCVGISNAYSDDWYVPHTSTDITNWRSVGYTSQKLIESCDAIIDAVMAAFPNQVVVAAINPNGKLDQTADYASSTVITNERAKWGSRFVVAKNSLSATTPLAPSTGTWSVLYNARPDVAGQMLWFCYRDTTYRMNGGVLADPATVLLNSINAGVSYGMKYIEIYQTDVINLPAVISYAHSKL